MCNALVCFEYWRTVSLRAARQSELCGHLYMYQLLGSEKLRIKTDKEIPTSMFNWYVRSYIISIAKPRKS